MIICKLFQVIQSRQDGSVNFNRNWMEYKEGFGSTTNEHWIGILIRI
jgi:hypothetical protein